MDSETTLILNASLAHFLNSKTTLKNALTAYTLSSFQALRSLFPGIRTNFLGFTKYCHHVLRHQRFKGAKLLTNNLFLTFKISQRTLSSLGGSHSSSHLAILK
jgi:hypothetical protein